MFFAEPAGIADIKQRLRYLYGLSTLASAAALPFSFLPSIYNGITILIATTAIVSAVALISTFVKIPTRIQRLFIIPILLCQIVAVVMIFLKFRTNLDDGIITWNAFLYAVVLKFGGYIWVIAAIINLFRQSAE
jgi:hypothetical protein